MSLAADTAKTASNMNKALTLDYFIYSLEKSSPTVNSKTLLEMIHDHLSDLERVRLQFANDERLKTEMRNNTSLAEVLS